MSDTNRRYRPICSRTPSVLFALGLVWSGILAGCSDRDSVTGGDPDPSQETGTLRLGIQLQASNLVDASFAPGSPGAEELAGSPVASPSMANSSAASARPMVSTRPGEQLTLHVDILEPGSADPVVTETHSLDPGQDEETLEFELPSAGGQNYFARVSVEGSRNRPTGVTESGLLHRGATEPVLVATDVTAEVTLTLTDLVPQLWLREIPGVSHELLWSPVAGATSYSVRRSPEGSIPSLVETTSLDTVLTLPPGFQSGGSAVGYAVQAVLPDGATSAFSETRSGDDPGAVPPSAVTDLSTFQVASSEIVLQWTAPGDDGTVGRATRYDLRRSGVPIDSETFATAVPVPTLPPGDAGTREFVVVTGLDPESTYYFAVVAEDEAGNRSLVSNPVEVTTPDLPDDAPPITVTDLAVSTPAEGLVEISWSAPQDERDGAVSSYELRYSNGPMTEDLFPAGTLWSEVPTPGIPGSTERLEVSGLAPGTYAFALRSRDQAGNLSRVSNIPVVNTADQVSPDAIDDLAVESEDAGRVRLRWSASGDNGRSGRADRHEVRFAGFALDESNLEDASGAEGSPRPGEPGAAHELELSGFRAETRYWFAVLTYDEAGNRSLSNVAGITTPDFEPPGGVEDLVAEEVTGTRARLFWTAPGDNGAEGTATRYDLRFGFEPITEENFESQGQVGNMPQPSPGGTNEEVSLVASESVQVYLALRTEDETGQLSPLSNLVFVRFGDPPPDAPTDLVASAAGPESIRLEWEYAGGEDYFELERKSEDETNFRRIGVVDRNGLAAGRGVLEEDDPTGGDGPAGANGFFRESRLEDPHRVVERGDLPVASRQAVRFSIEAGPTGAEPVSGSVQSRSGGETIRVTNTGLTERTRYTYRLRAFGPGGPSSYSGEASATTRLAAPGSPQTRTEGADRIRVSWTQSRNPEVYLVQRAGEGEAFQTRAELPGERRGWDDTEVSPRTTYTYRIRAQAGGEDAVSSEVAATTGDVDAACAIETTSTDFGRVDVGSSRSEAVLITNIGGGRLEGSLVAECEEFLVEGPFDLGPGETAIREVVFAPLSAGPKSCTIAISGGCGTVDFTGIGEATTICGISGGPNDYGVVEPGSAVTHLFVIENVGGGTLEGTPRILDDESNSFRIMRGDVPYALAEGETREVIVRYLPLELGSHEALIDFGNTDCPPVTVFGSTPSSGVCAWVSEEIDFGNIPIGQVGALNWAMRNEGTESLSGILVEACGSPFSISNPGPFQIPPGGSQGGVVTFTPTEARDYECEVRTDMIFGPDCPPLVLRGRGVAAETCTIVPTNLDFGSVASGAEVQRSFTVTNDTDAPLDVDATVLERCNRGDAFGLVAGGGPRTIPAGGSHTVTVSFQSSAANRDFACAVSLGNAGCPNVGIQAVTEPPPCEQAPSSHAFGNVLVGDVYTRQFTLTNHTGEQFSGRLKATCQYEVGHVPEEDAGFDLAPGESHSFRFVLQPTLGPGECEIWAGRAVCDRIPVSWNGEFPTPLCVVSRSEIAVESEVGQSQDLAFDITNRGNTSLNLNVRFREAEGCAPFEFVTGGGESRLDPRGVLRVRLLYRPDEVGSTLCHVLPLVDGELICSPVSLLGTGLE